MNHVSLEDCTKHGSFLKTFFSVCRHNFGFYTDVILVNANKCTPGVECWMEVTKLNCKNVLEMLSASLNHMDYLVSVYGLRKNSSYLKPVTKRLYL